MSGAMCSRRSVATSAGPIGYNDRHGPYFKAGVYRRASPECPVVILMDDFSFRDETAKTGVPWEKWTGWLARIIHE